MACSAVGEFLSIRMSEEFKKMSRFMGNTPENDECCTNIDGYLPFYRPCRWLSVRYCCIYWSANCCFPCRY